MDNQSIKEKIYWYRKSRGYTQEQMADLLGISVTQFRSIENGSTKLIHRSAGPIAAILGLSIEELFTGEFEPEKVLKEPKVRYNAADMACEGCRFKKANEECENKLQALRKVNQTLKDLVDSKERDITHLEDIIAMMKRLKGLD